MVRTVLSSDPAGGSYKDVDEGIEVDEELDADEELSGDAGLTTDEEGDDGEPETGAVDVDNSPEIESVVDDSCDGLLSVSPPLQETRENNSSRTVNVAKNLRIKIPLSYMTIFVLS